MNHNLHCKYLAYKKERKKIVPFGAVLRQHFEIHLKNLKFLNRILHLNINKNIKNLVFIIFNIFLLLFQFLNYKSNLAQLF